ncbi:MAG: hypothetical protein R2688_07935 [Fimbriimonadaceae bacterium]
MAPHFQRVNLAENWVIPKSAGRKLAMPAVLIALLTTAGCLAQVNSSGDSTTIILFLFVGGFLDSQSGKRSRIQREVEVATAQDVAQHAVEILDVARRDADLGAVVVAADVAVAGAKY